MKLGFTNKAGIFLASLLGGLAANEASGGHAKRNKAPAIKMPFAAPIAFNPTMGRFRMPNQRQRRLAARRRRETLPRY